MLDKATRCSLIRFTKENAAENQSYTGANAHTLFLKEDITMPFHKRSAQVGRKKFQKNFQLKSRSYL